MTPQGLHTGQPGGELFGGAFRALAQFLHLLLFLPEQASDFAVRVDRLQYVDFVGFWIMGMILFAFVGWFVLRYRRPKGMEAPVRTERVVAPLWLELLVGGSLLAFFVASWIVGFGQYADQVSTTGQAYDVYVTGKQWTWKFDYPSGRTTAGILYLPEGQRVRLLITSRDVIHSFFVPEFRIKRDAVPGRYNEVTFTPTRAGRLRALCAEYCGSGHSHMWADVVVLPPRQWEEWLESGRQPTNEGPVGQPSVLNPADTARPVAEDLAERGQQVATQFGCFGCHTVDGTIHLAPTWLDLYGSREVMQNGDTVTVDAGYITQSMMDPQARIVKGFGPIMPSFRGQINEAQTAAIIEYIRSLSTEDPGLKPPAVNPTTRTNTGGGPRPPV